jgi:uncharacterized linocin/CFP29 family protein
MSDGQLAWGDAEWSRIRQIVHDEALRTRVAASFLPLYGPLPGASETVPVNELMVRNSDATGEPATLAVNDYTTRQFVSVSVNVQLKNHMLADPELAAATILFRRAAGLVARAEDSIIFNGKIKGSAPVGLGPETDVCRIRGEDEYAGLVDLGGAPIPASVERDQDKQRDKDLGRGVFLAVVEAVNQIESAGYHRPFAVVLGNDLFTAIHTPIPASMVLPRDGIPPIIEGPLLRSSSLPPDRGLVISLQGDPVEIVVPSDISVRYLQSTLDGAHVFRVSQRFLLRVKDKRAIAVIGPGRKG